MAKKLFKWTCELMDAKGKLLTVLCQMRRSDHPNSFPHALQLFWDATDVSSVELQEGDIFRIISPTGEVRPSRMERIGFEDAEGVASFLNPTQPRVVVPKPYPVPRPRLMWQRDGSTSASR